MLVSRVPSLALLRECKGKKKERERGHWAERGAEGSEAHGETEEHSASIIQPLERWSRERADEHGEEGCKDIEGWGYRRTMEIKWVWGLESHQLVSLPQLCVLVRETVGLNLYNGNNYPFGMLLCENKLKMMMSRKHVSYCIAVSLLSYHLLWNFGCDQPCFL